MNNYWIDADLERMNKSLQDIEHETAPVRWSALSKSGIQSICIPSEFGGMGLGVVAAQSAFESAGRILSDQSLAFSFAAHVSAFQFPVSLFATQQLKKQTLRKCVEGSLIGSFAATEHEAGSDIANISTEYVSCPSGFRLSGRKEFVTNAPISNSVLVLATRNKSLGLAGLSAFVVDTSLPGVIRSAPLEMQGQNAALIGSITLSDCIVPKVALLGTEGDGFHILNQAMVREKSILSALHIGRMQRLLAIVINHAKNRVQFGRAISSYDSVYSMIVDMKVAIDAGRNLMFSVGRQIDDGHDASIEASVAKLFVSESYVNQARDAVQVFGAQATLREHAAINELLTAIPSTIYSGTSEIQRRIIAKSLGLF